MGEQETVTIHGARTDRDGTVWVQMDRGWYFCAETNIEDAAEVERRYGPLRPVRVVTTEPPDEHTLTAEYCGHDDDRREALTWASRQFRSAGIEDMHAVADAVLALADRYLAWLRGSDA